METINTGAICITFVLEWHDEMFIVFHRGNAKRNQEHRNYNVSIGDVTFPVEIPLFSARHHILKKFTNDFHAKYNVYQVLDDELPPLQRQVSRVAIKELSPLCHVWNSKGHPVP